MLTLESKASSNTGTKSIRTTLPKGIVSCLGLKKGDKIEWKLDKERKIIIMSRKKMEQKKVEDFNNTKDDEIIVLNGKRYGLIKKIQFY